ncbi:MAG: PAS domain S-box protein, partial [bacterium]
MFKKIEKKDAINIFKIFLTAFIPVAIGIFLLVDYISGIEIETTKRLVVSEQKQKIDTVEYIIKSELESNIDDMMVIKDSQEMNNYTKNKSEANKEELANLFVRIAKNKIEFDQIRLINYEGNEEIRVNNRRLKEPYIVKEEELQNNQERYYFQYAEDLNAGETYISPIDLNKENGEVKKPHKPSMRFATPVINQNREREGILVINYLAENALNIFDEYLGDQTFIDTDIVNNEGYYLSGDYSETFGFIIPGNEDNILKSENPKLWDKIENEIIFDEYFSIDNVNYYVAKISFFDMSNVTSPNNDYYIISAFDDKHMPMLRTTSMINSDNIIIYLLITAFLGLFAISVLYYYFRKSRESYNTVQLVADRSNDAVFITDSRYNITFVNKSLEDLTGYTEKELTGKNIDIMKTKRHNQDFYRKIHRTVKEKGTWKGKIWNKRKDGIIFGSILTLIGEKRNKQNKIKSYIGILENLESYSQEKFDENLFNFDEQIFSEREYNFEELIDGTINEVDEFALAYLKVKNNKILEITHNKNEYNEIISKLNEKIKRIIGTKNFLYKLSRSEYIFEIKNIHKDRDIQIFMKDFFTQLSKPAIYNKKEIFFDIKCGLAVYPDNGKRGRDLITNAKIAFKVLQDENDEYQIYHKTLRDKLVYESKINENIKEAVKNKELFVWYQPQLDSITEKVIGGEALLRWYSKELGLVPPDM